MATMDNSEGGRDAEDEPDRGIPLLGGRSPLRYTMLLAADAAVAASALWIALFLRFDGSIPAAYEAVLPGWIALLLGSRAVVSVVMQLHRWSFKSSGLADGMRVVVAAVVGTVIFLVGAGVIGDSPVPRSVVVLELLLTAMGTGALRFLPRFVLTWMADRDRVRAGGSRPTLVLGAAAAGDMLLRDLQRSREHNYTVVGFLDDDPRKWGLIIHGVPVLGPISDLPQFARRFSAKSVLITIRDLPALRVREILSLCADLKVRLKILPVSFAYLRENVSASMLQDLSPEDLLPREPIVLTTRGGDTPILGRTALVTGAGGSIGSEICRQLLDAGAACVVMVDINENELYMLSRRFETAFPGSKVVVEVGDIRDPGRMDSLFRTHRPSDVFHAAAHKHVPLMETAPCEAVKNNVLGTLNVARAAASYGARRFVYISTDKAVRPSSVMGATKRLGEFVVRSLARNSPTRFTAVRFGNVLGSAGSVVPLFREQIAAGGPVTVTHPDVRRFFMTISEAVGLVLRAAYGDHGELCVLDMGEQLRIDDLARHMITMAGLVPDHDIRITYTGLRPGEKLSEELLTEEEEKARRVEERILVIDGPPPPPNLESVLDQCSAACLAEDTDGVLRILSTTVPGWRTSVRGGPAVPTEVRSNPLSLHG
jgi:FlaA1/EpsC-like NDP-sugar epimerase